MFRHPCSPAARPSCATSSAPSQARRQPEGELPATSEEATKVLLSLLLTGRRDRVRRHGRDWVPHGIIKRVLTAEKITERILGLSKTATVSTRTLFLGSGNNVAPCATCCGACSPFTSTRAARHRHAALQQQPRREGAQRSRPVCRRGAGHHPRLRQPGARARRRAHRDLRRRLVGLLPLAADWLGLPDPATALLQQVKHDPDGDALGALMTEWHKVFKSTPVTVRKAVESANMITRTCWTPFANSPSSSAAKSIARSWAGC